MGVKGFQYKMLLDSFPASEFFQNRSQLYGNGGKSPAHKEHRIPHPSHPVIIPNSKRPLMDKYEAVRVGEKTFRPGGHNVGLTTMEVKASNNAKLPDVPGTSQCTINQAIIGFISL